VEAEKREQQVSAALLEQRFALSTSVPQVFFEREAAQIAEACWAMARRFHQGGRLLAFGNGAWATDAQHVSVEFVHPVIVGKRALPALALTNDSATISGLMAGGRAEMPFSEQLRVLARPQDIALGFSPDGRCANVLAALAQARKLGLLSIAMLGSGGEELTAESVDFRFVVPSDDPLVIQEVHETLYHILWELVHIFFEHEGLLQ
jgi:D-sedoheptulose 7-phosphate isomerase